jgi:hypothetical protein
LWIVDQGALEREQQGATREIDNNRDDSEHEQGARHGVGVCAHSIKGINNDANIAIYSWALSFR